MKEADPLSRTGCGGRRTVLSLRRVLRLRGFVGARAGKRVVLPKLHKRQAAVLDQAKLGPLVDETRGTRLYPVIVMAVATGCRRDTRRQQRRCEGLE